MKYFTLFFVILFITGNSSYGQIDYNQMDNWVFHHNKNGTLLDGYNLDIAVVDHNLNTVNTFDIVNNAMTNTGVDVFFVHPTILIDLTGYTDRVNIPLSDQSVPLISASVLGQAGLLSKYGRFFAPRYRQGSPPAYMGSQLDSTQAAVISTAYGDVKAAFLNYLNNFNNGNKIILASHSQGAYLTAMLLKDIFDNNPNLQNLLITAVIAGVVNAYATPSQFNGGWWQNISFCTSINQCGCVMGWRSYKEGQTIPAPSASLPCRNSILVESGYVYRLFNIAQDWVVQDSLYYTTQSKPLRYYLVPKTNQSYGGSVGFIAFDSLYQIRYQRQGLRRVGFMVEYTPKPVDQRPNILLAEESNPLFNFLGYHNRDYSIYGWELLEQIDLKLAACGTQTYIEESEIHKKEVNIYPNPSNNLVTIKSDVPISIVEIYNMNGQFVKTMNPNSIEYVFSAVNLNKGVYYVKIHLNNKHAFIRKLIKE